MAETIVKKEKKNYFDEKSFQELLARFKESAVYDIEGKVVSKDRRIEEKLCKEIVKVVNAVIYVHNFNRWEPFEDLQQHAMIACFTNFLKFNTDKGTAFNYFSLITKKSCLNYTTRKQKHRGHQDIEDHSDTLEERMNVNIEYFADNLEKHLLEIVDENFVGLIRKKYLKISVLITDYIKKTQKFINKTDLFAWIRSYGLRTNDIKDFIKDIMIYKKDIFNSLDIDTIEEEEWDRFGWK